MEFVDLLSFRFVGLPVHGVYYDFSEPLVALRKENSDHSSLLQVVVDYSLLGILSLTQ